MEDFIIYKDNCACKGIRSCLLCENNTLSGDNINVKHEAVLPFLTLTYCSECEKAWQFTPNTNICKHSGHSHPFTGVEIMHNFVSTEEEHDLVSGIDTVKWVNSQSGRRKQDYGPKVNFKKKKVKTSAFTGLPPFSKNLVHKMKSFDSLSDFIAVEVCNLEYTPERGSAIDPHFDDFWLWGERLVTLNLLSDTAYTMTSDDEHLKNLEVVIEFPRRSLLVLRGPARHVWKHAVQRQHIVARRIGITMRELSHQFTESGPLASVGSEIIEIAQKFNGVSVGEYETTNGSHSNLDTNNSQHSNSSPWQQPQQTCDDKTTNSTYPQNYNLNQQQKSLSENITPCGRYLNLQQIKAV